MGMWKQLDKWRNIPTFRHRLNHMADREFNYREHMAEVIAPILQLAVNLQQSQALNDFFIHWFLMLLESVRQQILNNLQYARCQSTVTELSFPFIVLIVLGDSLQV